MARRFDYFVILGSKRTGSNMLQSALASAPDLMSLGELFNPAFIGAYQTKSLFGIDLDARAAEPLSLLAAMQDHAGTRIPGFRLFPGHDGRVLDHVLQDPACAKIVLRRNPLDSFVSMKIAEETNRWLAGPNASQKPPHHIRFKANEFLAHLDVTTDFHTAIRTGLARNAEAAIRINYEDLLDDAVLGGIARFIGSAHRVRQAHATSRKQNPGSAISKVTNPLEMARVVQLIDRSDLFTAPDFEPRRRLWIPQNLMMRHAPLMFLPVPGTDRTRAIEWMQRLDAQLSGGTVLDLAERKLRRRLDRWMRRRPGHIRFSVVDHPLARAHRVFWTQVLMRGGGGFPRLRAALRRNLQVDLPQEPPGTDYDPVEYRRALLGFLRYLPANLARQTGVQVNENWASQSAYLDALRAVVAPHHVYRADRIASGLGWIAQELGIDPAPVPDETDLPIALAEIHDRELEEAARAAYARDYAELGFGDWAPGG